MVSHSYIKIPSEIILAQDMGKHRALIFSYLYLKQTFDSHVQFSINNICEWMSYKPDRRKNNISNKIVSTLGLMLEKGYFDEVPSYSLDKGAKHSNYLIVFKLNTEKFSTNFRFASIFLDELEAILNYKSSIHSKEDNVNAVSPAYVLLVLAYIRVNMCKLSCCFRYYQTISSDIGLSRVTVANAVKILTSLNIIACESCPAIVYTSQNKTKVNSGIKIFANTRRFIKNDSGRIVLDENYDAQAEIERQIAILGKNSKQIEK